MIQQNISLKNFNTFKTGGPASYFCSVKNENDVREAVEFARSKKIPFFVLGGGSNVLISDSGFSGLIIKMENKGMEFEDYQFGDSVSKSTTWELSSQVKANVAAGEIWDYFVAEAVKRNLFGVENLSGIPGTVGASPVQNIGAYGAEVSQTISSVEVFDVSEMKVKKISAKDCRFGYRQSIFKTGEGKNFIILKVVFRLKKNGKLDLNYKDLQNYFSGKEKEITLKDVREAVLKIRKEKLPDLKKFGTAGSFFKNSVISQKDFEKLKSKFPEIPFYPADGGEVKVPLAWILDKVCNLKGARKGNVGAYEKHPLILVNFGGATGEEIKNFSEEIAALVKQKTGQKIFPEVEYVGF